MNKILPAFLLLCFGLTQRSQAQLASFTFSLTSQPVPGWTDVVGDPHQGVRQATMGGITISSVDTSNWVPDFDGECAEDGVGAWQDGYFPAGVLGCEWQTWCGWNFELSHYNPSVPQLRLSGLNKDSTYILRMSASSAYIGGATQYTVTGAANYGSQTLVTYYNQNVGITFTGVKPDASGHVNVYVNSTPSGGALISAMQVWPGSTVVGLPTVAITAPANGTVAAQGTIVTIKATASETGQTIAKMEFFADSVKIGEVDTVPYTFNWINPDTGHYKITARATDNIGTAGSASINLAVQSLNNAIVAGDGLSMLPNGLSLGDSVTGVGPHSLHSNRYQYLNGYQYSFGGSRRDPVNKPVFRLYDNGDWSSGTTMDPSVNTKDSMGMRYNARSNLLQVGASDRIDSTIKTIAYGPWPTSGLLINTDEPNTILGRVDNTVFTGDAALFDTSWRSENSFIGIEGDGFTGPGDHAVIESFVGAFHTTITSDISGSAVLANSMTIPRPVNLSFLGGYLHTINDSVNCSLISGTCHRFGGIGQVVAGIGLVNRTPGGAALGRANVDFSSLPYTGWGEMPVPNLSSYPLLSIGNAENSDGTVSIFGDAPIRSNALTVLYDGRTQINTTGFNHTLSQSDVTPQAALDVVSTNSGVLLPRLTNAQRNAIAGTDLHNGLLLYNTDSSLFQYYNGSAWNSVGSGSGTGGGRWLFSTGTATTIYDSLDNIAIGTSDPKGYKLAVNGSAIVNTIKVKATNLWPDYVFYKNYVLPGLAEVERYIHKYHHLPGIVSATEAEKDGVDLGSNQAAMLKKIEELTLYTIKQDKQISDLQKEVEELKELIKTKLTK